MQTTELLTVGDCATVSPGAVIAAKVLRRPDVQTRTGLSRSSIYDGMAKGTFPRCVKLGARAVGWLEDEIAAWLEARKAERDAA